MHSRKRKRIRFRKMIGYVELVLAAYKALGADTAVMGLRGSSLAESKYGNLAGSDTSVKFGLVRGNLGSSLKSRLDSHEDTLEATIISFNSGAGRSA